MEKNLIDLFGSSSRVRILKLFLNNPQECFNVAEIAKITKVAKPEIRKQVKGFIKIGLVKNVKYDQKKLS